MKDSIVRKRLMRERRRTRVRARVFGSAERPRLVVARSLSTISAQVIDDRAGKTLLSASLKELKKDEGKNTVSGAAALGRLVAKKCSEKKIDRVVFDRAGYSYHGKIKAVCDAAREGGLIF